MNEVERLNQELREVKKENEELKERLRILEEKINQQKKGMKEKASKGEIVTRAAFGYKISEGKLVPSENWQVVENIFLDFKDTDMSLNKLAKKYGFSVNGIKKILTNFTYIGKVKFNGEVYNGEHKQLVSSTLFNQVQDKLERLGIKK